LREEVWRDFLWELLCVGWRFPYLFVRQGTILGIRFAVNLLME